MALYRWRGKLLRRLLFGGIAHSGLCCCGESCCANITTDKVLRMTLTNNTDCPCIDGVTIDLTYDPMLNCWTGTGTGGDCALLSETWRLCCSASGNGCYGYTLSIGETTACNSSPESPVSCTCDPIHLEFQMYFTGIGCCDGAMSGAGTVDVLIEEAP